MPEVSFNTDNKVFIREYWNKPIIKFLTKRCNDRLLYMGLPSPKGEDVLQWLDFIKIVIAFQCRQYPDPSDPSQPRDEVDKLEELLRELERKRKIDFYVVYDGYLEEVIFNGHDNSPKRIKFSQDSFITLYNLDFCNKISSPFEFIDDDGNPRKVYKFNVIGELLGFQKRISKVSNKFIFLLTVHCSYDGAELQDFINSPPTEAYKGYLSDYRKLRGAEKNSRVIRLFVVHYLFRYFQSNDFNCKILPVIRYTGINDTPLLHFVVIGIAPEPSAEGVKMYQNVEDVVNQKFLTINSEGFVMDSNGSEKEEVTSFNPVELFTRTKTYTKLWEKK